MKRLWCLFAPIIARLLPVSAWQSGPDRRFVPGRKISFHPEHIVLEVGRTSVFLLASCSVLLASLFSALQGSLIEFDKNQPFG
jgi:hypothetical protein